MLPKEKSAKLRTKIKKQSERGAALAIAIIMVAILAVISLTALAFSSSEARIAGSDLQRTRTFYATISSLEKMTNDFSDLFTKKMRPLPEDLDTIAATQPQALVDEGFTFQQKLEEDKERLAEMQATQKLSANVYPRVNIPEGPFAGLYATVIPYKISSIGTFGATATEVKLEREFNNYLVPLFQFGIFSDRDIEMNPGVQMIFNGRIHSNENVFALSNVKFLNRLTMAGELVRDSDVGGASNALSGKPNVYIQVGSKNVKIDKGSVKADGATVGGPNLAGSTSGTRGYFPGRPNGVENTSWETTSIMSATGAADRFGGQILTGTTGAKQLKLPLQLEGSSVAELIKRSLPSDSEILAGSRYHTKSQIRILIDDLTAGNGTSNVAGIPAGKGVSLRNDSGGFNPLALDGGSSLRRVDNFGNYLDSMPIQQYLPDNSLQMAETVRGIKNHAETVSGNYIPQGAGIEAKILIEVVKPDGTTVDVTSEILSLGMTQGEPNGIVYLQRPLWAAYTQGSRDRSGKGFDLATLTRNSRSITDGEIPDPTPFLDSNRGFISTDIFSFDTESILSRDAVPMGWQNEIVPINVYNVREGWYRSELSEFDIYERGMTSVVEINMRNLAKWLDGLYDSNLLSGTNAVSTNIKGDEGYVVYVSDRRGDRVKAEYLSDGSSYASTNGIVDNEDIYGPNDTLDEGEDIIDFGWDASKGGASKKGTLQKDTNELPDTGTIWNLSGTRQSRSNDVLRWRNPDNYFRRAVRLFDGENLSFSGSAGKLSQTKGITIATENMLYVWGSYNTLGVSSIPAGGATLNDGGYLGNQVPASLVCDAIFPLSKTWFDGLSSLYPEGSSDARNVKGFAYRMADDNLPDVTQSTAVRAAIIAGTTASALTAKPGRDANGLRKAGGTTNFPRFLEIWNMGGGTARPWSYTGSINPLYYSTQAVSQWENATSVIYMPPLRNWSFDSTFLNPNKLPPGTPFFQYVQATGFRQNIRN